MSPRHLDWIGAACLAAAAAAAQAQPQPQPVAPGRIVAVSDVHGAYDAFVGLLETVKLVDANVRWIGGADALVVVGDSVDRGDGSRRVLELLMRLETAAAASGGRVQLVLGNHEVMNLTGATDYVSAGDFAAYAAEERAADREAALVRFRAAHAAANPAPSADALAAEFSRRYPPGYFGQRAAFSARGALGQWLLRQPVMLVLGDTAFVHGGLPPSLAGKSAADINAQYAAVLRDYSSAFETLRSADVLHDEDAFGDRPSVAERRLADARAAGQAPSQVVLTAADRLAALTRSDELGDGAVYWYRGSVSCSPAVERDRVARFLAGLGVARVVVGHTPTGTGALSRFDGALLRVDTGMQQRGGRATAIVLQGGQVGAVYAGDPALRPIPAQPRTVGVLPPGLDDAALEDVLRGGDAAVVAKDGDGARVAVASAGRELDARFAPASQGKRGARFAPEVAAYRLDRLLGLELVPAAVLREVDGVAGVVQLDQSGLVDEERRAADREGAGAWCPLRDQFALMYLFDSLAGSEGRRSGEMRYEASSWQLVLTGNARLFGAAAQLPAYLRAAPLDPSPSLTARLRALDAKSLTAQLGDVLDAKRIQALLARRDALLAARASGREPELE